MYGELPTRRSCSRLHHSSGRFLGPGVEEINPKVQVAGALAVLVAVALSGFFLVAFVPGLWWIFTTYFWVAFPALSVLARGAANLSEGTAEPSLANSKERELLGALREHGELTPALAAMETSLTVAEADRMLRELAEGGHLEVKVSGGGLFYALWDSVEGYEKREPGDQQAAMREARDGDT